VLGYTISFPAATRRAMGILSIASPIIGTTVQMGLFPEAEPTAFSRKDALRLDPTGFNNLTTQFPLATQMLG